MSPRDLPDLGAFIVRHRKELGLTQEGLAERSGVSGSTIFRLEGGEFGRPDPEKLQRIARALGVDAEDLFELAGYAPDEALPSLRPYLRRKLGLSEGAQARIERYIARVQRDEGDTGGRPTR